MFQQDSNPWCSVAIICVILCEYGSTGGVRIGMSYVGYVTLPYFVLRQDNDPYCSATVIFVIFAQLLSL